MFTHNDIERELLLGKNKGSEARAVKQFIMQLHPQTETV